MKANGTKRHWAAGLFLAGTLAAFLAGLGHLVLRAGDTRAVLLLLTTPRAISVRFLYDGRIPPDHDAAPYLRLFRYGPYPLVPVSLGSGAGPPGGAVAEVLRVPATPTRDYGFTLPHALTISAAAGMLLAILLLDVGRFNRRKRSPTCGKCGYDVRASPVRCPECGTPVTAGTVRMPLLLRLPADIDGHLRTHPALSAFFLFLAALAAANLLMRGRYIPPPGAAARFDHWNDLRSANVTLLYPVGELLTSSASPLEGSRDLRAAALITRLQKMEPAGWPDAHPTPVYFHDDLFITAAPPLHARLTMDLARLARERPAD